MVTSPVPSNPDVLKLIKALELFEQTFDSPKSELELQATLGALATVMNLKESNLNALVHRVVNCYQQTQSLGELVDATKYQVSAATIQKAKERLTDAEETLIRLIRTYLQRVSSKLSATEFVELTKAAVALLAKDPSNLSFPESKRLLYIALQTFGTQLSQPIPALGEQIPKRIAQLLARLIRHQKIIRTDGLADTLIMLAAPTIAQRLSPDMIRTALENSPITIVPELDTQEGLEDLTSALFFKLQLQMPSLRATKSEQEIAEQLNQAIAEFKTKYQPLTDVTQPQWDNDLSISSSFFTASNFETASNNFTWPYPNIEDKSSKDETSS
ncbi:MAG: hypothetical protein AAF579_13175 [Cyanobacteria bacterium P01_C01_bin.118]